MIFILCCLVSGMVGAFGMAICAAGSYEKGYEDGKNEGR